MTANDRQITLLTWRRFAWSMTGGGGVGSRQGWLVSQERVPLNPEEILKKAEVAAEEMYQKSLRARAAVCSLLWGRAGSRVQRTGTMQICGGDLRVMRSFVAVPAAPARQEQWACGPMRCPSLDQNGRGDRPLAHAPPFWN